MTAPRLSSSTVPAPVLERRTLVWIMSCSDDPSAASTRRPRALTNPTERLGAPGMPGRHSTAMVGSPSCRSASMARAATAILPWSTLSTATSLTRSTPTTRAGSTVAVGQLHGDRLGAVDDVRGGEEVSVVAEHHRGARRRPAGRGGADLGHGRAGPCRRWPARTGPGPWAPTAGSAPPRSRGRRWSNPPMANTRASMAAAPSSPPATPTASVRRGCARGGHDGDGSGRAQLGRVAPETVVGRRRGPAGGRVVGVVVVWHGANDTERASPGGRAPCLRNGVGRLRWPL